jgi:hypothetical protein
MGVSQTPTVSASKPAISRASTSSLVTKETTGATAAASMVGPLELCAAAMYVWWSDQCF